MNEPEPTDESEWRPLTTATTPARRQGVGITPGVIALLVGGILLVALVVQNSDKGRFRLLWIDSRLPLSVLVLGSALIAVIVDEAVGVIWRRRRRRLLDLSERAGAAR